MNLIKKNSPNHYNGRGGWKADVIVFHQTGGDKLAPALNWYLNPAAQCSPHFVIDTNGDIYQLVNLDNGAWCNGTNTTPGDRLFYGSALSPIVRARKTNANYYTYSVEFVHCLHGEINNAQITAAVELIVNVIIPHMKSQGVIPTIDRDHLIGHSDVAPIARPNGSCPGKNFPFDTIISSVRKQNSTPHANDKDDNTKAVSVTLAFDAAVRSEPNAKSRKISTLTAGSKCAIIKGSDSVDPETKYIYVKLAGGLEQWIVKSAIKT